MSADSPQHHQTNTPPSKVALAMKRDLDELRDATQDLEADFPALIEVFGQEKE